MCNYLLFTVDTVSRKYYYMGMDKRIKILTEENKMKKALNLFDLEFDKVFTRGTFKGLTVPSVLHNVSNPEKLINKTIADNKNGKSDFFMGGVRVVNFK